MSNLTQNDFRDIEFGDTESLQDYLDEEFDVESHVDNLMNELNHNLDDILDDTSREVRSCIEENWPAPTPKERIQAKWAALKRGLTSEEMQELALHVAYLGSCAVFGWAVGKGVDAIYNKLTGENNG